LSNCDNNKVESTRTKLEQDKAQILSHKKFFSLIKNKRKIVNSKIKKIEVNSIAFYIKIGVNLK
jgi:hypothetical protein